MNVETKHPPTFSYKIIAPKPLRLSFAQFDFENNFNLKLIKSQVIINSN